MSIHHELMRLGRRSLRDNAGRPVVYVSPDGVRVEGVLARYTSAEDVPFDSDGGEFTRRELIVSVEIGAGDGCLAAIEKGGGFLVDVDGSGVPTPWTIDSFINSDASGSVGAGWRRCRCLVDKKTGGRHGMPRPTR